MKNLFVSFANHTGTTEGVETLISNTGITFHGKLSLLSQTHGFGYAEKSQPWRAANGQEQLTVKAQSLDGGRIRWKKKELGENQFSRWFVCGPADASFLAEINNRLTGSGAPYVQDCRTFLKSIAAGEKKEKLKDFALSAALGSIYPDLQEEMLQTLAPTSLFHSLNLAADFQAKDLASLPSGSFAVQFQFQLLSHWFSKDDYPLYPLENPVRKETVFKVPEMAASGWKGVFREVCQEEGAESVERLFGEKNMEDAGEGSGGALHFFSSFFDRIEPYTINPHDRTTKAGRKQGPISFEVVPPGAKSRFSLLYCPLNDDHSRFSPEIVAADHRLIGILIQRVFAETGFGAKTAEGFGRGEIFPPPAPQKQNEAKQIPQGKVTGLAALAGLQGRPADTPPKASLMPAPDAGNVIMTASSCLPFETFSQLSERLAALDAREVRP